MEHSNFLSKLSEYEPDGSPFISVYLNMEPDKSGKKDFDRFLKKQLNDHAGIYNSDSEKRSGFDAAGDLISDFIEALDSGIRGAAVFASAGPDEFFQGFRFSVPFDDDLFSVEEKPHIFPLARLIGRNPAFVVAAADTNAARIFVITRGKTLESAEIQNVKTNRSEVGGWSQARYQRHIDNFHEQHAKEVVAELEKIVRDDRIDRVVLAGDQAVIIPLLREEMSKELSEKIVASLPLNIDTPEHELIEAAEHAVREHELAAEKEKIGQLIEQNYDGGLGVAGVEKTLAALLNGQVQELYVLSDLDEISYDRNEVGDVLRDYAPGEDGDLPDEKRRRFVVDELLTRAAESAEEIIFVEDVSLLKKLGGVGALLRYQVKGVSNP